MSAAAGVTVAIAVAPAAPDTAAVDSLLTDDARASTAVVDEADAAEPDVDVGATGADVSGWTAARDVSEEADEKAEVWDNDASGGGGGGGATLLEDLPAKKPFSFDLALICFTVSALEQASSEDDNVSIWITVDDERDDWLPLLCNDAVAVIQVELLALLSVSWEWADRGGKEGCASRSAEVAVTNPGPVVLSALMMADTCWSNLVIFSPKLLKSCAISARISVSNVTRSRGAATLLLFSAALGGVDNVLCSLLEADTILSLLAWGCDGARGVTPVSVTAGCSSRPASAAASSLALSELPPIGGGLMTGTVTAEAAVSATGRERLCASVLLFWFWLELAALFVEADTVEDCNAELATHCFDNLTSLEDEDSSADSTMVSCRLPAAAASSLPHLDMALLGLGGEEEEEEENAVAEITAPPTTPPPPQFNFVMYMLPFWISGECT